MPRGRLPIASRARTRRFTVLSVRDSRRSRAVKDSPEWSGRASIAARVIRRRGVSGQRRTQRCAIASPKIAATPSETLYGCLRKALDPCRVPQGVAARRCSTIGASAPSSASVTSNSSAILRAARSSRARVRRGTCATTQQTSDRRKFLSRPEECATPDQRLRAVVEDFVTPRCIEGARCARGRSTSPPLRHRRQPASTPPTPGESPLVRRLAGGSAWASGADKERCSAGTGRRGIGRAYRVPGRGPGDAASHDPHLTPEGTLTRIPARPWRRLRNHSTEHAGASGTQTSIFRRRERSSPIPPTPRACARAARAGDALLCNVEKSSPAWRSVPR